MKTLIYLIACSCCLLFAQSLQDLRHTPEGQVIRLAVRMPMDEAHLAALQAAAASKFGWSRDALELSIHSARPSIASQPDLALYRLLTSTLMYDVSVENCRYYTPLLARMAKEVPDLAFGVTKLLGRANSPESAAALAGLADNDDVTKPASLSNLALSVLTNDVNEAVAQPIVQGLISRGHSPTARQTANVWGNRHQPLASVPPSIQSRIESEETMKVMMTGKSAAELASYVAGQNQHEAEVAVKVLSVQAQQHPQEVRSALEKSLESSIPTVRVRAAAVLLDIDSQSSR